MAEPTIERLTEALQKADAAGDTEGAKVLANAIRGMQSQPQAAEPSTLDKVGNFAKRYIAEPALGGLESATSLTTGALAAPVALGAGVAGMVLPGPPGQGADYMNRVMEAGTYKPQTGVGQVATDVGTYIPRKIGEGAQAAGEKVADVTGSPTAGAITQATAQVAPMLVGRGLAAGKGAIDNIVAKQKQAYDAAQSRGSVKAGTWEAARNEGYVVPPTAIKPGPVSSVVESVGGKAAVGQQAAIRNQEITNKIARREAGLKEDEPLTSENLEVVRDKLSQPYRDVAKASPVAAKALEDLQAARAESKAQWNYWNKSGTPEALKAANAADAQARSFESVIDAEAKKTGDAGLLPRLREARVAIAKNGMVDRALNDAVGNVDAGFIGRQYKKGVPLTDGLETIGKFAQAFSQYSRESSKVPTPSVSKMKPITSAALGALGFGLDGGLTAGIGAALPYLESPARSLALSSAMQPKVGLRPYSPSVGLRAGVNLTDRGITDPATIFAITEEQRKRLAR